MQSNVAVNATTNKITGTLTKLTSGQLVTDWGEGYFLALKWSDPDVHADELWVGLNPSVGSGLIECIEDTDRNGVFKITDPKKQKFIIKSVGDGYGTKKQEFDLSGLVLSTE